MNGFISRAALLDGSNVRKVTEYDESGCGIDYNAVPVDVIEAAPAVPMVHCRDCAKSIFVEKAGVRLCNIAKLTYMRTVKDDDFCSFGRRKDAEGE